MPRRRSSKKSFNYAYLLLLLVALVLILPYAQKVLKPAGIISISGPIAISEKDKPQIRSTIKTATGEYVFYDNSYYVITLTAREWNQLNGYKIVISNETLADNKVTIDGKQAYLKKTVEIVIRPMPLNLSITLQPKPKYVILPSLNAYYYDFKTNTLKQYSTNYFTINAFTVPQFASWSINGGYYGYAVVNGENKTFSTATLKQDNTVLLNFGSGSISIINDGYLAQNLVPPSVQTLTIIPMPKEYKDFAVQSLNGSYYGFVSKDISTIANDYCLYWYGYDYQTLTRNWGSFDSAKVLQGYGPTKIEQRNDLMYNHPGFVERQSWEAAGLGGTSNIKYYYHPRDPSNTSQISVGTVFPVGWPFVAPYNKSTPEGTQPSAIGFGQVYFSRSGMNFWDYITSTYDELKAGTTASSWTTLKDTHGNEVHLQYDIRGDSSLVLIPTNQQSSFFTEMLTILVPVDLADTFVYNPGLSDFKITSVTTDFPVQNGAPTLVGGGSGKISVTVKNIGNAIGNAYVVVVPDSENVQVVPREDVETIGAGQEATSNFQVSVANVDLKNTPIHIYVKDYVGNVKDNYTLYINTYAQTEDTFISMAYFEPDSVTPPAEVDLIVRISSTGPRKVALVLSDYDKSIFNFATETQTFSVQLTNDYEAKFHAKVWPFSTKYVTVKVTMYDEHNTKLSEKIATLYQGGVPPPPPPPIDWTLILMLAGVIIILFLIIVLLAGGKGWVANLPLFLVILVVIVVLALLVTGYSFSKITSILPSFANFLPSSNFGQVPLYIVLGLPGIVLLLFAGNMKKNIRTTATMLGLLLTIGAVLSFMYASNILVPFEVAVVSVIFAFIIYLVGRRGKTGPKGERKSSGSSGTSTTVHFSWGGK